MDGYSFAEIKLWIAKLYEPIIQDFNENNDTLKPLNNISIDRIELPIQTGSKHVLHTTATNDSPVRYVGNRPVRSEIVHKRPDIEKYRYHQHRCW